LRIELAEHVEEAAGPFFEYVLRDYDMKGEIREDL
jgi:hypothetical protein